MKKRIVSVLFVVVWQCLFVRGIFAQGVFASGTLYTFIVNIAGEGFALPLIGVANIARGDHSTAEIGVLNINAGSFWGIKAGVVNFTGGDLLGLSAGVVNMNMGELSGISAGVLNVAASGRGIQASAANVIFGAFSGFQTGVLNVAGGDVSGFQAGAVNVAASVSGVQIGAINIVADGENTIPIGLIPIVLNNGYYALEASVQDLCPVNLSIKMGVEKLYTTLGVSYNFFTNTFQYGGGLGTIIHINDVFFFNMEIASHSIVGRGAYFVTSAEPALGYALTEKLSLIAGPTVEYVYARDKTSGDRFFQLAAFALDASSAIVLGAKAAARFRF